MFKFISSRWALSILGWVLCFSFDPPPASPQPKSVNEVLAGLGRGPTLGSDRAPVTIVEFSDFQCSYCKRFWADTLPRLKAVYIDTGKARFTYRHFAILGRHSERAALAAACALEQDKFWPYHDQLFQNQGGLAFSESKLQQYARDTGLNTPAFDACLGNGKYNEKVARETASAASLGGRGTPFFFVNQHRVVGAQPYAVFQKLIDEELQVVKSEKTSK